MAVSTPASDARDRRLVTVLSRARGGRIDTGRVDDHRRIRPRPRRSRPHRRRLGRHVAHRPGRRSNPLPRIRRAARPGPRDPRWVPLLRLLAGLARPPRARPGRAGPGGSVNASKPASPRRRSRSPSSPSCWPRAPRRPTAPPAAGAARLRPPRRGPHHHRPRRTAGRDADGHDGAPPVCPIVAKRTDLHAVSATDPALRRCGILLADLRSRPLGDRGPRHVLVGVWLGR